MLTLLIALRCSGTAEKDTLIDMEGLNDRIGLLILSWCRPTV